MDDYAEYLAAEASSDVAALHQFRILYDERSDDLHLFFEGEDDSLFYMPEVRRLAGKRIAHVYDCGGKENVVEVRDTIKDDGYEIASCLFFVDRDYDDYLGTQIAVDDFTYITDNYSIENDIASVNNASLLLEDVVRISRADPEFSAIMGNLKVAFDEFYKEVRPLMAWIVAAREAGCKPNLKNTKGLKDVAEVDASGLPSISSDGFRAFRKMVLGSRPGPALSVSIKWRRQFDMPSCKSWVRGKYEIWFFQKALLAILDQSNGRRKAAGGKAFRIPTSLRDGRIFEVLGGRVAAPTSLQTFLDQRLTRSLGG
jgi:hypothetical protein